MYLAKKKFEIIGIPIEGNNFFKVVKLPHLLADIVNLHSKDVNIKKYRNVHTGSLLVFTARLQGCLLLWSSEKLLILCVRVCVYMCVCILLWIIKSFMNWIFVIAV